MFASRLWARHIRKFRDAVAVTGNSPFLCALKSPDPDREFIRDFHLGVFRRARRAQRFGSRRGA